MARTKKDTVTPPPEPEEAMIAQGSALRPEDDADRQIASWETLMASGKNTPVKHSAKIIATAGCADRQTPSKREKITIHDQSAASDVESSDEDDAGISALKPTRERVSTPGPATEAIEEPSPDPFASPLETTEPRDRIPSGSGVWEKTPTVVCLSQAADEAFGEGCDDEENSVEGGADEGNDDHVKSVEDNNNEEDEGKESNEDEKQTKRAHATKLKAKRRGRRSAAEMLYADTTKLFDTPEYQGFKMNDYVSPAKKSTPVKRCAETEPSPAVEPPKKRGRGRPPKIPKTIEPTDQPADKVTRSPSVQPPKRRGRPPKVRKPSVDLSSRAEVAAASAAAAETNGDYDVPVTPAKRRGRPPKATPATVKALVVAISPAPVKRGRGRPRKVKE